MINALSIRNYALIRELDMHPSGKLNIITGETGAGKSIMLGAVGLLLGNRADTKVLWDTSAKCRVEGVFDISAYKLRNFFEDNDLDFDNQCIIRREINPAGKSRAFINDTPVKLDVLKQLGEQLMDVHSQHESLSLGSNRYQREILDAFCQHEDLIEGYQKNYKSFNEAEKRLQNLINKANETEKDLDYNRFLLKELEEANLEDLDQEALETQLSELENAEEIKIKLGQIDQIFDNEEYGVMNQLKEASTLLRNLVSISSSYESLFDRLESTSIELRDIQQELQNFNDQTLLDPEQLSIVKNRLDLLYRLQKKHMVTEVDELIKLRDELAESVADIDNLDEAIQTAEKEWQKSLDKVKKSGKTLSDSRRKQGKILSKSIEELIHGLGMENGQVTIDITESQTPQPSGMDDVSILFSANKGIQPREIKEVASGGEFSRLIFAIKFLVADKTAMPTIIFDEIDTGVSGEVAMKMISMMRQMSQNHQVISISHLPQFAAGGDSHYFVFKDHSTDKSETKIKLLEPEERVEAIAKMIGGNNPTEKSFESARELLQHPV